MILSKDDTARLLIHYGYEVDRSYKFKKEMKIQNLFLSIQKMEKLKILELVGMAILLIF